MSQLPEILLILKARGANNNEGDNEMEFKREDLFTLVRKANVVAIVVAAAVLIQDQSFYQTLGILAAMRFLIEPGIQGITNFFEKN